MKSRIPTLLAGSFVFAALATTACRSKGGDRAAESRSESAGPTVASAGSAAAGGAGSGSGAGLVEPRTQDFRKIVRTGHIELVVTAYDTARAKLDAIVEAAGGYIDSTHVERRQDQVSDATIVVRVPEDAFGALVPKLSEVGNVTGETTNADDITDRYVDVSARLASAQTLEKRLLALASDRAASLDQVLSVEHELERVRGEIEGYEGHLRQWNDQVAMSTLTISIETKRPEIVAPPVVANDPSLGERTAQAFHGSVSALRDVGSALLVACTALLPWLLVLAPGALLARRIVRRYRRRLPEAVARDASV